MNIVQKVPSSSFARELPLSSHSADIRTDPGKTDRIHGRFIYKNDFSKFQDFSYFQRILGVKQLTFPS